MEQGLTGKAEDFFFQAVDAQDEFFPRRVSSTHHPLQRLSDFSRRFMDPPLDENNGKLFPVIPASSQLRIARVDLLENDLPGRFNDLFRETFPFQEASTFSALKGVFATGPRATLARSTRGRLS